VKLQRHESFPSQFVQARHVDVWLPDDYSEGRRYAVLYMHDGQNIVEAVSSIGGISWRIDQAIERLGKEVIVVGVWNHSDIRWREYMPQQPFASTAFDGLRAAMLERMGGEPFSDLYLKYLVEEVKPFIDKMYATLPEKQHTVVMGSSMGGLISLYAISQYPHMFGGAGCVSTHWSAGEFALVEEMAKRLPDPAGHKLYFDYGTRGVDAPYEPLQLKFDEHLRTKGFTEGKNWVTRKFEGADHNEAAWQARVDIPLSFLFS
jgi:predicted alpha/beta superfamily hydrolase